MYSISANSDCLATAKTCDEYKQCCAIACVTVYIAQCFDDHDPGGWSCACASETRSASFAAGTIVGIVIGTLVLVACSIVCIVFIYCKYVQDRQHEVTRVF